MSKNIPAVIYARFSSSSQREESIEDQLRECNAYAKREGYTVIGNYCDYAISGRTDERPEFLHMISDAEYGSFKAVIVYRLDRFARNRVDSVIYKSKLSKHKVHVVSATECIPEGSDGVLLEALHEALAQKYSDDLSKIIRRGQEGNAENCKVNGPIPFGYKANKVTRHIEVDEEKAAIVRQAFTIIASGGNYKQALSYFAKMGYPKTNNGLYKILNNERYKGIYIYGSHRVEGGIPRIISDELFNAAKATRARNVHMPNSGSAKYLLSGKLYCRECEHQFSGSYSIGKNGNMYRYYVCSGKKRWRKCEQKDIRAPFVEQLVTDALHMFILNDEITSAIIDAALACQEEHDPRQANITALSKQIAEADKKIKNIMTAIEAGIITSTTKERLEELEGKKKSLQQSLMEEKLKAPAISRRQLEYYFDRLKSGSATNRKFQKYLVDSFVQKAYTDGKTVNMVVTLAGATDATITYSKIFAPNAKVYENCSHWWR